MSDDVGTPVPPADAPQIETTRTLSILPRLKQATEPTPDGSAKPPVVIPNDQPPKVEDPNLQEILSKALLESVEAPPFDLEPIDYDDPNSPAAKRGRPAYKVDPKLVYAMALNGAKQWEIAAFFGCSKDVIKKRFGDLFARGRAARMMMIRQGQTNAAMAGSAPMLIWLGKQELKQIDESRIRIGNLSSYSDEELEQIARGKLPGQLNSKNRVDNPDDE
jgi:hypothetical protein